MTIKNLKTFIYPLIVLSIFVQAAPLFAPPSDCEELQVARRRVWCRSNYDPAALDKHFFVLRKQGYTPLKAIGKLGELYARHTIESKTEYVSIITLFKRMGCNVENVIRDGADHGIDDIFVMPTVDGRINRNFNPIFHEAKYNGNCELKLAKTKTICQQLSKQWLTYHIRGTQQRTITGAELCFDNNNALIIKPCEACKTTFVKDMDWLFEKLQEQNFHRRASVLCPNGQLRVYKVMSKE